MVENPWQSKQDKCQHFLNFYFLETHPSDNSGQPHALEHMVFQGSKNYPQKVKYNDIIKMQKLFDSLPRFRKNSISQ